MTFTRERKKPFDSHSLRSARSELRSYAVRASIAYTCRCPTTLSMESNTAHANPEPSIKRPDFASCTVAVCPACGSERLSSQDVGRKTGAAIGALLGGARGFSAALSGATIGANLGMGLLAKATPPAPFMGALAGAILGGMSGGLAGCAVGAALGEAIDGSVLSNCRCLSCGHVFSHPRA